AVRRQLARSAADLGLPDGGTARGLEALRRALADDERERQRWEERSERRREAGVQRERREAELTAAQERLERAAQVLARAQQAWSERLRSWGLRVTLTPAGAVEVVNEARGARERLAALEETRREVARLRGAVEAFARRARQAWSDCGREPGPVDATGGPADDPGALVGRLVEDLAAAREVAGERDRLQERLQEARGELDQRAAQLDGLRRTEQELLAEGASDDREAFARRARAWARGGELLAGRRQQQRDLERLFGVGDGVATAVAALAERTPAELEAEREAARVEVEETQRLLAAGREELGRLKQSVDQLEQRDESARLRLEQSVDQAHLESLAREWAVWTLCRSLLEETRLFYERERRPGVIREAEGFFGPLTGGAYERIVAPLGGREIRVETSSGVQRTADQLSRGTAEQLYLALRLGLVREFGRQAEPLPVVVDDILVNFDPERARQAAVALAALARGNQVIVLTCHPATVDLLADADPGLEPIVLAPR
ncbi:MAG: hypothetical protein ABIL09_28830, partial [Gemmatimonadota bacterium]